ncbi:hypothetical protein [Ferrimonas pelagia]|uniref:Uncharacterized protein n=1 Tax=Ferrimonas pelagia TaxID=1177826 RepID=A0ABP9FEF1_9GAMM
MDTLPLFSIYLLYGMAFFAMGIAIGFRDRRHSRLAIAPLLPLLGAFGLLHGLHEWSELYLILFADSLATLPYLPALQVIKLWLSFILLGYFAWRMLPLTGWRWYPALKKGLLLILLLFVCDLILRARQQESALFLAQSASQIRWLFGLGSATLAGAAMIQYSRHLLSHGQAAANSLAFTGVALKVGDPKIHTFAIDLYNERGQFVPSEERGTDMYPCLRRVSLRRTGQGEKPEG